jgi:transcriptional regulator with XRE-family HTH domain
MDKGLTIQELADKCKLDRSFLSRLERGQREWTVLTLERVAKGLGVKLVTVFG